MTAWTYANQIREQRDIAVAALDRAKAPQDNVYASALAYLGYLQGLGGNRNAALPRLAFLLIRLISL